MQQAPRIRATNFRRLRSLDWSPSGVVLLAGPNGAGKSTTLDAIRFLSDLFRLGHEAALRNIDGRNLRSIHSAEDEPVTFELNIGEIHWKLAFPVSTTGLRGTYGEELRVGDKLILRTAIFDDGWDLQNRRQPLDTHRCCAKVLWDRGDSPWMKPLVDFSESARWYPSYWMNAVKRPSGGDHPNRFLHWSGQNLWDVLANWKGSPMRSGQRFDWVMHHARLAFPDQLSSIEFDRGSPFLYGPDATDSEDGLPPRRAADGLLTGLLHLTAIAGAASGSLLSFDEIENQLHPHAIRQILQAFEERAASHKLTVVLTTHSLVVLNNFVDNPENIFVLAPTNGSDSVPNPLTEHHDEAWLAQSKPGTLYDRLAFAAPTLDS